MKTTEWFTCMGGAARCPMCGVYWCGAVGTVAGPPAQGGIQILGDVPHIQEQIVEMVLTVAESWVDRWDWVFVELLGVGLTDGISVVWSVVSGLWSWVLAV